MDTNAERFWNAVKSENTAQMHARYMKGTTVSEDGLESSLKALAVRIEQATEMLNRQGWKRCNVCGVEYAILEGGICRGCLPSGTGKPRNTGNPGKIDYKQLASSQENRWEDAYND